MSLFEVSSRSLLLGGITGYLIGSIPSAYIVTRWKTGLDLRREGTGNIGTVNAYEVTGRKTIGAIVLSADVLKGLLPVILFEYLGWRDALIVLIPALVLGHCYPVWLRFHGGRGLATAAGSALPVNPPLVLCWLLLYLLARKVKDHVHFGAIVATGALLAIVLLTPTKLLRSTTLSISGLREYLPQTLLSITLVLLIVLSRHVEPFITLIKKRRLRA